MDSMIKELIDSTKIKFGLDNYYLARHSFSRKLNFLNETNYTLCMEWFPNHVSEQEDEDLNPVGTAVIDLDINSHRYESVIFVDGTSFANGIRFADANSNTIASWIEQETGLIYGKQFKLFKEEKGEFYYKACFDDVYISPSDTIEVKIDEHHNLTFFSKLGLFPSKEMIRKEVYTLSLEKLETLAWEQLKLFKFPSSEQKLIPLYAMEEIYVRNDGISTIPNEVTKEIRKVHIDKPIFWDEPIHKPFKRKEIRLDWDVTIDQALSNEPSPDSFPINKVEQEKCIETVTEFLRGEYSTESGNWILKTLERDVGYIHASLRLNQRDNNAVFHRKLTIIIDSQTFQVINYLDNEPLINHLNPFTSSEEMVITKKEAYEKIKDYFTLVPYYVYDYQQQQYMLCGRLDCNYGICASNGEIMSLDDL